MLLGGSPDALSGGWDTHFVSHGEPAWAFSSQGTFECILFFPLGENGFMKAIPVCSKTFR